MQRRSFLRQSALALAPVSALSAPAFAARSGELVIGQTGILTGPLGAPIVTLLKGSSLVFDAVNMQGGVHGRKLRLVSLDDELKPDVAVANYKTLLDKEDAFCFFGCVGSGTTAAAAPVLKAAGTPSIGGFAVADSARDKAKDSLFMVRATTKREAEAMATHLRTLGLTRIAMVYLDNPGGVEALKLFTDALAPQNLKPVATAAAKDPASIKTAAAALVPANPQAVIMYLGGTLGGEMMRAMAELKSRPSFYGMSIVPGELTAKALDELKAALAISQVMPYPWAQAQTAVTTYRKAATDAKVPVGYISFEGYVNALLLVEALNRAGPNPSRGKLENALRGMKANIAGMDIDFRHGGHTGSRFIELVQVTREGRYIR